MFRFSIRELMLVTLVAGLAVTWWLDRREDRRWKKRATAFEHVLVEDGWKIEWRSESAVIITKLGNNIGEDHGYNLKWEICDCGPSVSF